MLLPELQWCDSGTFFEKIDKMVRIFKAGLNAYLVDGQIRGTEQLSCVGEPHLIQILQRRGADVLGKIPAEPEFVDADYILQVL